MGIEREFLELMPQTIAWEQFAALDKYGEVTDYADPVDIRCRVTRVHDRLLGPDQVEVLITAKAWLFGHYEIKKQDRITLPDGTQPPIADVEHYPDEEGDHHTVVLFGS